MSNKSTYVICFYSVVSNVEKTKVNRFCLFMLSIYVLLSHCNSTSSTISYLRGTTWWETYIIIEITSAWLLWAKAVFNCHTVFVLVAHLTSIFYEYLYLCHLNSCFKLRRLVWGKRGQQSEQIRSDFCIFDRWPEIG